jgi:hypothetical protein
MVILRIDGDRWSRQLSLVDLERLSSTFSAVSPLFAGADVLATPALVLVGSCGAPVAPRHVTFRSEDGYSVCFHVEALAQVLLAFRLGAAALPTALGGPIRLVVPGDRCRSLKRVASLYLSDDRLTDVLPACDEAHASLRTALQ